MPTTEFLITSLIVVLIPGTGVIFTVSAGLMQGRRAAFLASIGCTLGIIPHLLATVLGLAAVMHASALAFEVLKYAGVAYLLYLAVATWRDRSAFTVQTVKDGHGPSGLGSAAVSSRSANEMATDPSDESLSAEHPEPQAHDLFPGFPAAVRRTRQLVTIAATAVAQRRVHADDLRSIRGVWLAGRYLSNGRHRVGSCPGLAAAGLCRCICRAWRAARVIRS